MRALVSASAHFALTPDGALWAPNASLEYAFWTRYLDVYDGVQLLVRCAARSCAPAGWARATGPGVTAIAVPDFVGPLGLARRYRSVSAVVRAAAGGHHAVHARLPCPVGSLLLAALQPARPYGVELVADAADALARGAFRHPLRPLLRWSITRRVRRECARAAAVAYVTERALQRRYPAGAGAAAASFSSLDLYPEAFVSEGRPERAPSDVFRLVVVTTLNQPAKGTDVLLRAVALCARVGLPLELEIIGEGRLRSGLEQLAHWLRIAQRVRFTGAVRSAQAVRERLDDADLFVLPSRMEGLPRALLEAMARALPCVATAAGGIPELLAPQDVVPVGDAGALAARILAYATDPPECAAASARNLERARAFRWELLRERRIAFYRRVEHSTAHWWEGQRRGGKPAGSPRPVLPSLSA